MRRIRPESKALLLRHSRGYGAKQQRWNPVPPSGIKQNVTVVSGREYIDPFLYRNSLDIGMYSVGIAIALCSRDNQDNRKRARVKTIELILHALMHLELPRIGSVNV